eukprot:g10740.t1
MKTLAPRQPSSLARLLTPSAARAEQIRDALEQLQTLVVGHLGLTYYLKPQGSYAQNLLLPNSDLDLVLCSTDEPLVGKGKAVRWLQNLAGWFRRSGNSKYHPRRNKNDPFVMEQCIFQARIPIMKLKYQYLSTSKNSTSAVPGPLDIDISSGDDRRGTCDKILDEVVEGLERKYDCQSSRLSSSSSSSSSFSVRLFLRFLKAFAGEKGLNVTWERGLSNFSWVLLGVIYLQQRTRPNAGGEKELREIFFGFVDWFCTELLPEVVEKGRWLRVEYETKRKKKSDPIGSERAGEEGDDSDESAAPPKYKKRSVYDPVLGTVVPGADEGENAARCLGPRVWEEKIVPILQRTYAEMDGRGRGGSSGRSGHEAAEGKGKEADGVKNRIDSDENAESSSESESDSDDEVLDAEREKAAAEERKQRAVKSGNRMLYGDERLVEVRNLLSKKPKPPAQMKKNNRRRKIKVKKQGT